MSALTAKLDLDPSGLKRGATQASAAISGVRKDLAQLGGDIDEVDARDVRVEIEADIAKAEANLSEVRRSLLEVDGMDARADVQADVAKAEADLGALRSELRDLDGFVAEPEIEVPDAERSGGIGGMEFAKGAIGAIGVAGIGTALVTMFNEGMDRIQVRERITQQFGLIEADAERYGEQAGDIYASGWGNSTNDVLASLALIDQKLVQTGAISEAESESMATDALVVADVFGNDVTEVIDAVGKLMLNGLAPDAGTAMDLVAAAMQDGANGAGDLFDSIDEYSQHFASFGLGAEDMMALFSAGMANGQRDTDKLADAVKEMRIRTVEDGEVMNGVYEDLGLSADDLRAAILEGGPAAKEAFTQIITALSQVKDPVEQNRLAIEVMGTQYEDLGPTALDTFAQMSEGMGDVVGTVDEMNDSMSDTQSELEKLGRKSKSVFGGIAEQLASEVNKATTSGWDMGLEATFIRTEASARAYAEATAVLGKEAEDSRMAFNDLGKELNTTEKATKDAESASDRNMEAMQDERDAADDLTEAVNRLTAQKMDLVGGDIAVANAQARAKQAEQELAVAFAESGAESDAYKQELRDATSAQLDAASQAADYRIAQMEANGEVVDAQREARIHREELEKVAGTLAPGSALRAGVDGYVDDLSNIERNVDTKITSNAAEQDLLVEQLDRRIRNLQDKTITIRVNRPDLDGIANTARGGRAKGGPVGRGETYWVGEEGPELVTFPHNGYVLTAPQSAAIAGSPSADTARMLASASAAPFTGSSSAAGVATGGGGVTLVNSKASVTVADVAMAIRLARG